MADDPTSEPIKGPASYFPSIEKTYGKRGPEVVKRNFDAVDQTLAHLHRGTLVVRSFPDLSPEQATPRQAELELYVDLERDYIEMENQGAHTCLAPGESVDYATRWRFAAADPQWPTDRMSPGLLAGIEALRR